MLSIILPIISISTFITILLLMASTKRKVPITVEEAKTLWKIHKKTTKCTAHKWQPVSPKGTMLNGFKCECGYKYTQKKPLVTTSVKTNNISIQ
jgi:hypothetical protein